MDSNLSLWPGAPGLEPTRNVTTFGANSAKFGSSAFHFLLLVGVADGISFIACNIFIFTKNDE